MYRYSTMSSWLVRTPGEMTSRYRNKDTYVSVVLQGGLGNQLFQVASVWAMAKALRRPFKINARYILGNQHSSASYFDSLLEHWKPYFSDHEESRIIKEDPQFRPQDILKMIGGDKKRGATLDGYFQTAKYIDPYYKEFTGNLKWNTVIVATYDELAASAFIHVRGGDYLQSRFREVHYIDMTNYYKRALEKIKDSVRHFYVFTNDIPYLESKQFFDDIRYTVVPPSVNEMDSLYLMSQCKQGGIGVNSSFSWWGLYLDKSRPWLSLPDHWFNDPNMVTDGFYFPGVQKLSTDAI